MKYIALFIVFIIGIADLRYKKITIIGPLLLAILGLVSMVYRSTYIPCLLGLIPGAIIFLVAILFHEKIGIGDSLVLMALGLDLGIYDVIKMLLIALFILFFVALFLFSIFRKKSMKIAFIPFLFMGLLGVILL